MVKVGGFTVELVAADTKEPFKEHVAPDGQIYAEVEPDMDYYISLSSDVGDITMAMSVDGVDLGYQYQFPGPQLNKFIEYNGAWERKDGKETMTALRFNKTREAQHVAPDMLTGKVKVLVNELGSKYYTQQKAKFVPPSLAADSTLGGKKCIKSTTDGSHSFELPSVKRKGDLVRSYTAGRHICTITINYCSALGLIYHKILQRPPDSYDDSVPVEEERPMKRKRSIAIKGVVSPSGSQSFDTTPKGQTASSMKVKYKFGEHLRTIAVKSCSALGLIYNKILPRPLDSDNDTVPVKKERSMKRKRSTAAPASIARTVSPRKMSPTEKTTTIQDSNDEQVEMETVQKTRALVDLTGDD